MTQVLRIKARWAGFQGAPGFSVFHFRDFDQAGFTPEQATQAAANVRAFFDGIKLYIPNTITIQVESDAEVVDIDSGQMTDLLSADAQAVVTGTAAAGVPFAGPAGAVVTWRTNTIRNGRRMRGRTFLVPLSTAAYEANGTLLAACLTALNAAATALRQTAVGPDFVVYGRPPAGGVGAGTFGPVTAHSVPDMVAILSSRRD